MHCSSSFASLFFFSFCYKTSICAPLGTEADQCKSLTQILGFPPEQWGDVSVPIEVTNTGDAE